MSAGKPEIVFVLPDILGGVSSFNRNIINNASLRRQAHVKVILVSHENWPHPRVTEAFDADELVHFVYYSYENVWAVLKRLNGVIGTGPGALYCNEAFELEAVYQMGTGKTVYVAIHDFYNIKMSVKFGAAADVFLTHTGMFRDVLISSDPEGVQAFHLPHGVNIPAGVALSAGGPRLKIVFTGRLVESKGVADLYEIDDLLNKAGIGVDWTIIGRGVLKSFLETQWKGKVNVRFASPDTTQELLALMATNDIFILPTRFEGSPVTILEALATGLVPVVSDLPGGIREVVGPELGRRVALGDNQQFANVIAGLHKDC
jgi:glycosyltransferase involved in cell wall biosynthesis